MLLSPDSDQFSQPLPVPGMWNPRSPNIAGIRNRNIECRRNRDTSEPREARLNVGDIEFVVEPRREVGRIPRAPGFILASLTFPPSHQGCRTECSLAGYRPDIFKILSGDFESTTLAITLPGRHHGSATVTNVPGRRERHFGARLKKPVCFTPSALRQPCRGTQSAALLTRGGYGLRKPLHDWGNLLMPPERGLG